MKERDIFVDISSEKIVELLNSTREGSVWEILDIRLVSAVKDKVVATMPIGPHHRQQVGYFPRATIKAHPSTLHPPSPLRNVMSFSLG
ncbi:MAG: hypothetical protein AUG54_06525 [Ktedonobacter sp. 13_1_20CM_4_53_7]|nr:MAG: hypothetical protein AUG54_06525 [Ktedonobacter sp. 13_1_20CM_4_53_7]